MLVMSIYFRMVTQLAGVNCKVFGESEDKFKQIKQCSENTSSPFNFDASNPFRLQLYGPWKVAKKKKIASVLWLSGWSNRAALKATATRECKELSLQKGQQSCTNLQLSL